MATIIHLIRHGQTDWNLARRYQGRVDVPLNQTGLEQAADVAERMRALPLAAVVSSTMNRALVTAEAVASASGLPAPATDARLVEQYFGEAEGMAHAEVEERFGGRHAIPDAEPFEDMAERVHEALAGIAARYEGQEVAVVSHGAVIGQLVANLLRPDQERVLIHNCSVHTVRWDATSGEVDYLGESAVVVS